MALSKIKNASTDGSVAGGKVLQVVHAGDFAEQSFTLSTTPLATNMTATITPTDVTSKILITYTIATAGNSTGASQGCMHMPYHDIGQTGSFTALSAKYFGARTGQYQNYQMVSTIGHIYHDHNTTSAIDYTVYVVNSTSFSVMINRGGSNSNINAYDGYGAMTLMEISQ